jgi:hypothetical protein
MKATNREILQAARKRWLPDRDSIGCSANGYGSLSHLSAAILYFNTLPKPTPFLTRTQLKANSLMQRWYRLAARNIKQCHILVDKQKTEAKTISFSRQPGLWVKALKKAPPKKKSERHRFQRQWWRISD